MDLFIPMFIAGLALALKPGPHLIANLSLAIDGRWKSMLIFWVTAVTASSVNYIVLLTGLSMLPNGFGMLYIFIKSAGAIFFISIGFSDLQKAAQIDKRAVKKRQEKITKSSFFNTFFTAIATAFSNPYALLFILTAIPAITNQTHFTLWEIIVVRGAIIASDIIVMLALCIPLFILHAKIKDGFVAKLKYISAFLMIMIGLYLFVSMITQWDLKLGGLLG